MSEERTVPRDYDLIGQPSDPYAWYRAALLGVMGPVHEGIPQPGFYKKRSRARGPWDQRCAIWPDGNGKFVASINGEQTDPDELWLRCAKNPIPEADYRHHQNLGVFP